MTIKAIETSYRGYRFRSRLEARWAVAFDKLGLSWEYEPQGFVIDGRPYLPDFRIRCGGVKGESTSDLWIEVKGDEQQLDKPFLLQASKQLGGGLMVLGPIPEPPPVGDDWTWVFLSDGEQDVNAGLSMFWKNGRPWFGSMGRSDHWLTPLLYCEGYSPEAQDMYAAARSARFEHGQHGPS